MPTNECKRCLPSQTRIGTAITIIETQKKETKTRCVVHVCLGMGKIVQNAFERSRHTIFVSLLFSSKEEKKKDSEWYLKFHGGMNILVVADTDVEATKLMLLFLLLNKSMIYVALVKFIPFPLRVAFGSPFWFIFRFESVCNSNKSHCVTIETGIFISIWTSSENREK